MTSPHTHRGRAYRRCARRHAGKQLGARCPELTSNARHGTWTFAVDLPSLSGKRSPPAPRRLPHRKAATAALTRVLDCERAGIWLDDRQILCRRLTAAAASDPAGRRRTHAGRAPWQTRAMQIGVVYPQIELGGDPAAIGRFGRAVEDLGFDHLLAYDHVLGAVHAGRTPPLTGPYTEHDPFHDPFVMFAYLAAITERIGFGTGILVLPQRPTVLVARQAADVDLLSGGRLRLGVGVGWNYVEYAALGQDFRTRGAREEEQIQLLRRLFTEPVVDFAGRFDRVDRAALVPKPTRPIPIWLGGSSEASFDRAARLADGFIFFGGGTDRAGDSWKRLSDHVDGLGRPVEDFGAEYVSLNRDGASALAAEVEAWREAGGTHLAVVTMGLGFDSVDRHIDYLAAIADTLTLS